MPKAKTKTFSLGNGKVKFTTTPIAADAFLDTDVIKSLKRLDSTKNGAILFVVRVHPEMGSDYEDIRSFTPRQPIAEWTKEVVVPFAKIICRKYWRRASLIEIRILSL